MIYELKPKTKDSLKAIDVAISQQTKAIQGTVEAYQKAVGALNAQKNMILSAIIEEKEIDTTLKLKLTEDYNIEVISEEEYDKLMAAPETLPLDVPVATEEEAKPKSKKNK